MRVLLGFVFSCALGGAVVDLDPTIFDNILAADVYSVTGDQVGSATIQGRHVDLEFTSQTAGLGRSPGLPLLTITVQVLSTALAGATFFLTAQPGSTPWLDDNGAQYNPQPRST